MKGMSLGVCGPVRNFIRVRASEFIIVDGLDLEWIPRVDDDIRHDTSLEFADIAGVSEPYFSGE
jgi:hypothetical protein